MPTTVARRPLWGPALDRARRVGAGIKAVIGDLPEAASRELAYRADQPLEAILTLTWRCSCRCSTCQVWRRPRSAEPELTCEEWLDVGRKLLARGVHVFELFGGDVFLRKDVVVPLCRALHAGGGAVYIPTNSRQLDAATAAELVDCVHTFYLSMDALGADHDRMRGMPGTFDRVGNVLHVLQAARGDRPGPKLVCNTTITRHNVDQLADLAVHAARTGFDEISFEYVGEFRPDHVARSAIGEYRPSPIFLSAGESALVRPEQVSALRRQLHAARRVAGQNALGRPFGVRTANTDSLSDADLVGGTVPRRRCFMARCKAIVDPCGHLVPCVFFDTFSLGSVRRGVLDEPWLNERRRLFRQYRDRGRLEMCDHCIMSVVRNRGALDVAQRAWREAQQGPRWSPHRAVGPRGVAAR